MVHEKEFLKIQETFAKRHRLPVIRNLSPEASYVSALVLFDSTDHYASAIGSIVPTEAEAELLAQHIQYRNERWLKPSFIEWMKASGLVDIDPGVNTTLFMKSPRRGWLYRMNSWTQGSVVFPSYGSEIRYDSLLELLDDMVNGSLGSPDPHWEKFKETHRIS